MNLGESLPIALRALKSAKETVIAVLVADNFGLGIPAGSRIAVDENGLATGNFFPMLDEAVIADAAILLSKKTSTIRSYHVSHEGVSAAGVTGGNVDIFFEVLSRPPRLIIVGCGHIALPLARMGKLLEFEVIVIDDRAEYANTERFPDADSILVGPYRETLARVAIDSDTFIVLVTRGHVHDSACLEQVLGSPSPYVGMIGSRRRVRTVTDTLVERGHSRDELTQLFAPVGLAIASQTPAEIAVAIMAEIINVRRGGHATSLRGLSSRRGR